VTTFGRDCSNFTVTLTAELIQQWKGEGVGLCLLQAFPPSYHQYEEQRQQMRVCASQGMPFDCYIYDYLGAPDWLDECLAGLEQALLPSEKPRKLWLDEEDTETEAGWTAQQRIDAISWSLQRADAAFDEVGIYSAAWWWGPKTGNTTAFNRRELWWAQYDGIPDATVFTPFGGWSASMARVKQYAGSQPDGTDLNVLSAAEEAELEAPEPEPQPEPTAAEFRQALSYLADISEKHAAEVRRVATQYGAL